MSARAWSPQQERIFDWFKDGKGNAVVRARAGTGKTTTILEGIGHAPEERIILAAFNNAIVDELKGRVSTGRAEVKTLHGLGYALVRSAWEGVKVQKDRRLRGGRLVDEVCDGAVPDAIRRLVGKLLDVGRESTPHAQAGTDLVGAALAFDILPDEEWEDLGYDLGFICDRAYEAMVLAAAHKPADGIDFADMLYLPVRNRWTRRLYDLGVVDETQDMTLTQLEVFRGCVGDGRICVVGDDRQAIYGFRGADSESLDRLKAELDAEEFGLTTTYRCGRVIVDLARQIVPDYEAAPEAPEGRIEGPVMIEALGGLAQPGDFILSRTNAPLARVAMMLIRSDKRVRVLGREIGEGLVALVRKLAKGKAAASIPAFLERVVRWEERECERARAADREHLCDGIRDRAETLRVLADGVAGPRELEARLEFLFGFDRADPAACVTCSSVHKAKGKEADRVYVLRDTLYPKFKRDKPASPEAEVRRAKEEANIAYVAITRARSTLVWVAGK